MLRRYELRPSPRAKAALNYAGLLNDEQQAVVEAGDGPLLVIAGAGSGKTRALTWRVARLLHDGVSPDAILLLTFTNKAAREMMRRVADLLGSDLSSLWGGTFHAVGHRILRRHAALLGYSNDFTILDRADAKDLIQACLDESDIDLKATRFPKADVLGDVFSLAINTERSVAQVLAQDYPYFAALAPQIEALRDRYAARKRATLVMDFDDLLVLWLRLLQDHADVRELYQRRFQFILVDEYQDTNRLQSDLIDVLAARHRNVMVVGDDSQSIYSWRGANFHNILKFPERYPGARIYKIETNYRSTPEILSLANAAIAANVHQFAKQLSPSRKSGLKPVLVVCQDAQEQAAFVAQRVLELRDEGFALDDMAVLYRSHFHALELQLELTRRNIPFSITSGIRFFEQAHVKDVAAHLKLVCNPRDELAFKRLVRLLPGVGSKTADKLWQGFSARCESAPLAVALQDCAGQVPRKTTAAWAQFTATMAQLGDESVRSDPAALIGLVIEAGYEEHLQEHYTNYRARLEDLQQLASFARQFKSTDEFLAQLALLTNLEAEEDRPVSSDEGQLRLSTIHQAKGLEFGVVFIIMLCEGLFPSARSLDTPEGEEEERRLFYVAITRAKNELYLSHPLIRLTPGRDGDVMQQPSRFLRELPAHLRDEWNLRPFNTAR